MAQFNVISCNIFRFLNHLFSIKYLRDLEDTFSTEINNAKIVLTGRFGKQLETKTFKHTFEDKG